LIKYNYEISVNDNKARLNKDIFLFRGNRNIHYYFSIKGARFTFSKTNEDLIESSNAIYAAVTVIKPNGLEVANAIAPVEDGVIHLKVTEDLIDEEVEVGDFDLVFDLFDDSEGAVTIPKIKGQFHVQERPCETSIGTLSGNVNVVNQAVVDLAIATQENEQLVVVDDDGKYVKTVWKTGDKISVERLNKIEEGLEDVSSQFKDIANNQPTDLSLDSATNLLQLVNSKGSKLGNGITLPISSGGGTSQYLHIKYSTTGAPQLAGQISDTPNAYIGLCVDANADAPINPHSYTWYKWKGEAGAKGDTGATPSLQIGTVETLESGSSATASITGTTENPLLNLGIPRGEGGTGGSEKEWKLLKDLTLTETVSAITEIFDNDYKEILIIAKGKAGGTSNCGMAITSYSENQASGVDLVLSSILWQVNEECTFSIYLCAENPVLFLIWKRCNSSILSSSEGTYNSANWNDKKGINKLLFRYGTFAEGNNYKIYGR
jgi:hypothetical protein